MNRVLAAGLGVTCITALAVLPGLPAAAAGEAPPTWVSTAPPPSYAGGAPEIAVHQSGEWGARTNVYIYAPSGGQGPYDLEVSVTSATPAESISVNLAKMPEILAVEAFADAWVLSDGLLPAPEALMLDGSLVIHRGDACSAASPSSSEFEVALLGVSGSQYVALVDVNFGGRPQSCDTDEAESNEAEDGGALAWVPSSTNPSPEPEESTEASTADPSAEPEPEPTTAEEPETESAQGSATPSDVDPWLIALVVAVFGLTLIYGYSKTIAPARASGARKRFEMGPEAWSH